MRTMERRPNEGRAEYIARLGVIKSIGFGALAAAGAVLVPPLAAPLITATVMEGLGAGGFGIAQQHFKKQRLRKNNSH